MKKFLVLLVFSLITEFAFCQIQGVVLDSVTNNPVSFTNIWVEDENIGTTSDEDGKFAIQNLGVDKVLVFYATGYEMKRLKSNTKLSKIKLIPKDIKIQEVIINSSKEVVEKAIGSFKKKDINSRWGCGELPVICARLFPYNEGYKTTPYLKSVKVLTSSKLKNSIFNLRLYSVDKNGDPGDFIYNKNIIVEVKKGENITTVDISKLKVAFPKTGLYIAVEWLIIDQNKYEYIATYHGSKRKFMKKMYEPDIGTIPENSDKLGRIYSLGRWDRFRQHEVGSKKMMGKYPLLAIELTLTD